MLHSFSQKYIIKNIIIVQVVMSKFKTNIYCSDFSKITFRMTSKMLCSRFDDNRLFLSGGDFSGHLFSPWGGKEAKRLMEEKHFDDWMEKRCSMDWGSLKVWFQKTRSVFLRWIWIKFFYMNKYKFLWKATVFTKNTLQTRTEIFHCFDTFQQH